MFPKTRARNRHFARLAGALLLILQTAGVARAQGVSQQLHDLLPDAIRQSGISRAASPQQSPPYIFQKDGVLTGEAVDEMRSIEPILGAKFEFFDVQWPGVLPGIRSGNYDMSIGVVSLTKDREEILNLIPYRGNVSGILLNAEDAKSVRTGMDLCGMVVGNVQASVTTRPVEDQSNACVAQGRKPIDIRVYPSTGLVMVALQAGNVHGYPGSVGEIGYLASQSNGKYVVVPIPQWVANRSAVAVAKDKRGLAEAIAGALRISIARGTYLSNLRKYGIEAAALPASEIEVLPRSPH